MVKGGNISAIHVWCSFVKQQTAYLTFGDEDGQDYCKNAVDSFAKALSIKKDLPSLAGLYTQLYGDKGIRTPDLLNAIQTRSQLRHIPEIG